MPSELGVPSEEHPEAGHFRRSAVRGAQAAGFAGPSGLPK